LFKELLEHINAWAGKIECEKCNSKTDQTSNKTITHVTFSELPVKSGKFETSFQCTQYLKRWQGIDPTLGSI